MRAIKIGYSESKQTFFYRCFVNDVDLIFLKVEVIVPVKSCTKHLMNMFQESKDLIIKNFVELMKECDVNALKEILINKGVFTVTELNSIFSSSDARHNKRVFFFNIQKKEQRAFNILVESLMETSQYNLAELLVPGLKGCKPFCFEQENADISPLEEIPVPINPNTSPLNIKVELSKDFYDVAVHNKEVNFYNSRSKKRGKLLIINNYDYNGSHARVYRNGATVDNKNLQKLFTEMGGWKIDLHNNKTAEEINLIATQFSQDAEGREYDICFVIVMGHGNEISNETIIYGKDEKYISANDIQKHFTNERCKIYRGKPKIFLFQVCRGDHLDYTIRHTETDSIPRHSNTTFSKNETEKMTTIIRTQEDMLIGYATLHGYKAHRDPYRGSWYIELLCEKLMKHAHDHTVDDLLHLVDQGLRTRMSEGETMQTAEYHNKGFKKLYLNPGIYYEDGVKKYFKS